MQLSIVTKGKTVKLSTLKPLDVFKYNDGYFMILQSNAEANVVFLGSVSYTKDIDYPAGTLRNIRDDVDVIHCKKAELRIIENE